MEAKEIKKECTLAVLLLATGGLVLWQAYSYEPESRQFPVFLGWLFMLFSAINFVRVVPLFSKLSFDFRQVREEKLPSSSRSCFRESLHLIDSLDRLLSGHLSISFNIHADIRLLEEKRKTVLAGGSCLPRHRLSVFFSVVLGTRLPMGELFGL